MKNTVGQQPTGRLIRKYKDEDIQKRFEAIYGGGREFAEGQFPYWREKLSNLSEFKREIKVSFARY